MNFFNNRYIKFQPHKYSCYEFKFGSVDEILSVSSNRPVLQHDDDLTSTTDTALLRVSPCSSDIEQIEVPTSSSETVQVDAPSPCSETDEDVIPLPSFETAQVKAIPSCSETDENAVNFQVKASSTTSETNYKKVEIPVQPFKRKNFNTKVLKCS